MCPHSTTPTERVCTDCGELKPLDQFNKGNAAYGRKSYCKLCQSRMAKERRAFLHQSSRELPSEKYCPQCKRTLPSSAFNLARGAASGLQAYCRRCLNPRVLQCYYNNKDAWLEYRHRYYREHWNRQRNLAKQWRKDNRTRYLGHMRRYQALKRGAIVENVNYDAIWERDNGICYICGLFVLREDVHFDHVIPLSKGGSHTYNNVRVTHSRCNMSKSDNLLPDITS
jgi:5-methylcytosine-specific restriction endonuclease McrA